MSGYLFVSSSFYIVTDYSPIFTICGRQGTVLCLLRPSPPLVRQHFPEKYPYYRININHYAVFYVVIDNVMEVRRFLYGRRDISSII